MYPKQPVNDMDSDENTLSIISLLEEELTDRNYDIEKTESEIASCKLKIENLNVELQYHYMIKNMLKQMIKEEQCNIKQ